MTRTIIVLIICGVKGEDIVHNRRMKSQAETFERYVRDYIKEYGLRDWDFSIHKVDELDDERDSADTDVDVEGRMVTIRVCTKYKFKSDIHIRNVARHEILHVLTDTMRDIGYRRFVTEKEVNDEFERLVTQLENVTGDYERKIRRLQKELRRTINDRERIKKEIDRRRDTEQV